jgi:uncharacterized protein (TIGR00375 family)
VEGILEWSQKKGISLVGTGDVTHPGWLAEIGETLEDDGGGFLVPRGEVTARVRPLVPELARRDVRFVPTGEVSSIFRSGTRVRKVHTVVVLPGLAAAGRFAAALGRLGNTTSDGRPILGLHPRRILELARDAHPDAFVIPAHIWTPHFSLFGALSGFDSIEECFGDMSGDVFALETGLSSDIPMNRRWSALDRFALVSSSDAHSPSKLGREATVLSGVKTFQDLVHALRHGGLNGARSDGIAAPRLLGTVEFFPEEGKYHLDGHRDCGVRTDPSGTVALGGICPVCGNALTPGVLGRVESLADRDCDDIPEGFPPQWSLVPLAEILGEILGVGPASKRVTAAWDRVISAFGGELDILGWTDPDAIESLGEARLAEAIRRLRAGRVYLDAGFDGRFGRVSLFGPRDNPGGVA